MRLMPGGTWRCRSSEPGAASAGLNWLGPRLRRRKRVPLVGECSPSLCPCIPRRRPLPYCSLAFQAPCGSFCPSCEGEGWKCQPTRGNLSGRHWPRGSTRRLGVLAKSGNAAEIKIDVSWPCLSLATSVTLMWLPRLPARSVPGPVVWQVGGLLCPAIVQCWPASRSEATAMRSGLVLVPVNTLRQHARASRRTDTLSQAPACHSPPPQ